MSSDLNNIRKYDLKLEIGEWYNEICKWRLVPRRMVMWLDAWERSVHSSRCKKLIKNFILEGDFFKNYFI